MIAAFLFSIFIILFIMSCINSIGSAVDFHSTLNSQLKKERELFMYDPDQDAYFDRKTGKRVSEGERMRRMESSITEY